MKYYIAYGSNLNKEQMAVRCPDAKPVTTTTINDYQLLFRGNGRSAVATIEPRKGSSVPVAIWKISLRDEHNLDRYEGFPWLYIKKNFGFKGTDGRNYKAMAYIMADGHPLGRPSEYYLDVIEQGYEDFGMDTAPLLEAVVASTIGAALEDEDDE